MDAGRSLTPRPHHLTTPSFFGESMACLFGKVLLCGERGGRVCHLTATLVFGHFVLPKGSVCVRDILFG